MPIGRSPAPSCSPQRAFCAPAIAQLADATALIAFGAADNATASARTGDGFDLDTARLWCRRLVLRLAATRRISVLQIGLFAESEQMLDDTAALHGRSAPSRQSLETVAIGRGTESSNPLPSSVESLRTIGSAVEEEILVTALCPESWGEFAPRDGADRTRSIGGLSSLR